jgi:hypothetical protein
MNDDWRLRVDLQDEGRASELSSRLPAAELQHDLKSTFRDRVIVSRDGGEVFCYAATREQAEAARRAISGLADTHGWHLDTELKHWHPTAEEWEDPDAALPQTEQQRGAERRELMQDEDRESQEQGFPDFEVRVKCPTHRDARHLAERLEEEGIPTVRRWQFVVLGAPDEDSANALAERVRREAPANSTVTAEGSAQKVAAEAPGATPFRSPFAVFGGLAG